MMKSWHYAVLGYAVTLSYHEDSHMVIATAIPPDPGETYDQMKAVAAISRALQFRAQELEEEQKKV